MLCDTPTQSQFKRRYHLHTALYDDMPIIYNKNTAAQDEPERRFNMSY